MAAIKTLPRSHLTWKVLKVHERVEIVERNKGSSLTFLCCPVSCHCLWKTTLIGEKKNKIFGTLFPNYRWLKAPEVQMYRALSPRFSCDNDWRWWSKILRFHSIFIHNMTLLHGFVVITTGTGIENPWNRKCLLPLFPETIGPLNFYSRLIWYVWCSTMEFSSR